MEKKDSINIIESFDFKALGARILKYWYLFALSLIIGFFISYYKIRYSVPVYSTYGKMLLKDEYTSWGQEYFIKGMELVSARNRLSNEIGLISSFNMMRSVLEELNFDVFYYDIGDLKDTELYKKSPFVVKLDSTNQNIRNLYYYMTITDSKHFALARNREMNNQKVYAFNAPIVLNDIKLEIQLTDRYTPEKSKNKLYAFNVNDLNSLAKVYQRSINWKQHPWSLLSFSSA